MEGRRRSQCVATIIRYDRRCLKEEVGDGYCEYHGPLCQAMTIKNVPCNSMVLRFREGFIFCDIHRNVPMNKFFGVHSPTPTAKAATPSKPNKIKTTTTTTTTTTTPLLLHQLKKESRRSTAYQFFSRSGVEFSERSPLPNSSHHSSHLYYFGFYHTFTTVHPS